MLDTLFGLPKFLSDLLDLVTKLKTKIDPADLIELKKYWEYINCDVVYTMFDDLINCELENQHLMLLEQFLIYRKRPEHSLYDKKLERLIVDLDAHLHKLFDLTGLLFSSDAAGRLKLIWEGKTMRNLTRYAQGEIDGQLQYEYDNLYDLVEETFNRYEHFVQKLRDRKLLKLIASKDILRNDKVT